MLVGELAKMFLEGGYVNAEWLLGRDDVLTVICSGGLKG